VKRNFKQLLGCGAALFIVTFSSEAVAQSRRFDLPSQDAAVGIPAFGLQAGVRISAPVTELSNVKTAEIHGVMDVKEALRRLLAGTGLEVASYADGVIILRRASAPAPAQTGVEPSVDSTEDIVVTAQKRSERLVDVPMAVVAISGEKLTNTQTTSLLDLQNRIPGLRINGDGVTQNSIVLRGVSVGTQANAPVATYVDETPYGAVGPYSGGAVLSPNFDTYDLSRIEVLRGPQGTNYGAMALAGIVKYVPNAPDPTGFAASALVGLSGVAGGGTGREFHAMANVPISDKLAIRIVGNSMRFPGYIDVPERGAKNVNEVNRWGVRASLLWTPSDDLKIRLNADVQRTKLDDDSSYTVVASSSDNSKLIRTGAPFAEPSSARVQIFNATVNWNLHWASLVSATSYTRGHLEQTQNLDLGSIPSSLYGGRFASQLALNYRPEGFTQEIRLNSNSKGSLQWTVGAFFNDADATGEQLLIPYDLDARTARPGLTPALGQILRDSKYREYAGFANIRYEPVERLTIGLGARYSYNDQTSARSSSGLVTGSGSTESPSNEGSFTYSADAKYALDGHNNLYARIATGFVAGGPNNITAVPGAPGSYDSSTTTNYEIGMKGSFARGNFTYDLAVFRIDYDDIQISAQFGNTYLFTNGGRARSQGVEAAFGYTPFTGLQLSASGSYIDARLRTDLPSSFGGKAGDRLPVTPIFAGALSAAYERPLVDRITGFAGLDLAYAGNRITGFSTVAPRSTLAAYTQVDGRIGIATGPVRLTLYAKNLFNRHIVVDRQTVSVNGADQVRETIYSPRTIGFTISGAF